MLRGVGRGISTTHTRLYPLGVTGTRENWVKIHHGLFIG